MKLKIKVTKEIIKKAMWCGVMEMTSYVSNCAVALAVREVFPHAKFLGSDIVIGKVSTARISVPAWVTEWVTMFDRYICDPVKRLELDPIEFKVELTDEIIDLINIDEAKRIIAESSTLELVS